MTNYKRNNTNKYCANQGQENPGKLKGLCKITDLIFSNAAVVGMKLMMAKKEGG